MRPTGLAAGLACGLRRVRLGLRRGWNGRRRGSLKACHRNTPVQAWGGRTETHRQKSESEEASALEGFRVALVPATSDAGAPSEYRVPSTEYRQLLGSGRACDPGAGGPGRAHGPCRLPAGLALAPGAPHPLRGRELRTLRPLLPPQRSPWGTEPVPMRNPRAPRSPRPVWGQLLLSPRRPRCQARVRPGQRSFPGLWGPQSVRTEGRPETCRPHRSRGAAGRRGPSEDLRRCWIRPGQAGAGRCGVRRRPAGRGAAGRAGAPPRHAPMDSLLGRPPRGASACGAGGPGRRPLGRASLGRKSCW